MKKSEISDLKSSIGAFFTPGAFRYLNEEVIRSEGSAPKRGRQKSSSKFVSAADFEIQVQDLAKNPQKGKIANHAAQTRMVQINGYTLIYMPMVGSGTIDAQTGNLMPKSPGQGICIVDIRPNLPAAVVVKNRGAKPVRVTRKHVHASAEAEQSIVRKIPSLMQNQIDSLIEQTKDGTITPQKQKELDEMLDYLDDLTISELSRVTRNNR